LLAILLAPAFAHAGSDGPKGLSKKDLAKVPLTKKLLRDTGPKLSKKRFAEKLAAGAQDAVMNEREYPGAHWAQMKSVPRKRFPGKNVIIPGDDHFENYGFIKGVKGIVRNDFDDSGKGPQAANDARYYGVLRGRFGKKAMKAVLKQYVKTVEDPRAAVEVPKHLQPDWDKVREDVLAKMTKGDDFAYKENSKLSPIHDKALQAEIAAAIEGVVGKIKSKAFANELRNHGGSSGEDRKVWYGEVDGKPALYELKPVVEPAIMQYKKRGQPSMAERMSLLKKTFWGKDVKDNYVYVQVAGKTWLLRNRLEMYAPDVNEMKKSDRQAVLRAQVSTAARDAVAQGAWSGTSKDEIKGWIKTTAKTEQKEWAKVFKEEQK
jgi:hypothetical protein